MTGLGERCVIIVGSISGIERGGVGWAYQSLSWSGSGSWWWGRGAEAGGWDWEMVGRSLGADGVGADGGVGAGARQAAWRVRVGGCRMTRRRPSDASPQCLQYMRVRVEGAGRR